MPISDLARALMARELATNPQQFNPKPAFDLGIGAQPNTSPAMSPETLATLGGLADAGSTYAFLKAGHGSEANPLMANRSPAASLLGAVAGMLAAKGARSLVRKVSPGLADALAAGQGAEQLGLGVDNLNPGVKDSLGDYMRVLQRAKAR